MTARSSFLATEGARLLVVGVALIAFANFPPLPVRGAQISDAVAGLGALLVLASAGRAVLDRIFMPGAIAAGAYVLAACLSFAVAGGSAMRLLGYLWLPVFACAIATASADEQVALRIRRALIVAALIGAITGLAGAVLFWAGKPTGLLNHFGDLVPGDYPRIRGTLARANALAGLCALGLLLLDDVPRKWRIAVGAVLGLALVFTFSRTWIALGVAALVRYLAFGAARSRARDAAAVLVVLAGVAVMLAVSWLHVVFDPSHPFDAALGDGAGTRWIHLNDALATIAEHPLGVGAGRAATYNGWDAHFTPVNIAAVIGIPAAVAFVALVALVLVRKIRAARAGDIAARALAAALFVFCLDALARDIEDQRALWVVLGLSLSRRFPSTPAA